jgi:DNA-binding response OmpR family regulator
MIGTISVLLIAGHDSFRDALCALLTRQAFVADVEATPDRAEGIALAGQQYPNLIVLDTFRLKNWDQLCRELQSVSASSKLAVLHSRAEDGLALLPPLGVTYVDKNVRASSLVRQLLSVAGVEFPD